MVTLAKMRNGDIIRNLYTGVSSRQRLEQIAARAEWESCLKTFYKFFTEVSNAFPDYKLQIDSLLEKGNKIMVRYIIRGTHKGRFMGTSPTNEKTDIWAIDVFRLENGQIRYHWNPTYQISVLSPASSN